MGAGREERTVLVTWSHLFITHPLISLFVLRRSNPGQHGTFYVDQAGLLTLRFSLLFFFYLHLCVFSL